MISQKIRRFFSQYQGWLLTAGIIAILIDILLLRLTSEWPVLFLALLWWLGCRLSQTKQRVSLFFGLGFWLLTPIFLAFHQTTIAERTALWAYVLLGVGVIQEMGKFVSLEKT